MNDDAFELALTEGPRADVAWAGPGALPAPWATALHEAGMRVVAPAEGADLARWSPAQAAAWFAGCSALLHAGTVPGPLRQAAAGLPERAVDGDGSHGLAPFVDAALGSPCRRRAYAFFVGRLERDFDHAREALRVAVARHAGVDLLWSDDERHSSSVGGIRERTRLLLRHARFVLADLSLGVENPLAENPSRAHEIGMAVAYERPLLLTSQEPRRYPYFSVADMQMSFWGDERELDAIVERWLRPRREALVRRVLNGAAPRFEFDPGRRFVGPHLRAAGALPP